jgi:hypothetical protein
MSSSVAVTHPPAALGRWANLNQTNNMKSKATIIAIAAALIAGSAVAQPSPAPPAPPTPPVPPQPGNPGDRHDHDKGPKVPVTFLGVETSTVPRVVSEQLGLARGFGLVVDYVVPDGPAAAAGLQASDILKLLNDQILMEPDQLAKLIRSYPDGTTVTFTVLRKGQEQKIPVKLGKKEISQRHMGDFHMPENFMMGDMDFGGMEDKINEWRENFQGANKDVVEKMVVKAHEEAERAREHAREAGERAREQAQQAGERARELAQRESERGREEAQRARDEGKRARDEAKRVRDETLRNRGQIQVSGTGANGMSSTRIDLGKAQIVFSDDKGELRLDNNDGKKILTAKDPQGRLLFSGPVETKEDIDKIPADVRDRFNKLQQNDLPSISNPPQPNDDNDSDDSDEDEGRSTVEQVRLEPFWAALSV